MKSLFNPTENQEILNRINKLTPGSQAQWGKMNVSQMLSHCQVALKVAFGDMKLKQNIIGFLFGGISRKVLTKPEPFKRNLPTDKNFIVTHSPNFEEEKKKLIELVQRFAQSGPEGLTSEKHPFFGKLTVKEWDILQWKHLDHHLQQFGV